MAEPWTKQNWSRQKAANVLARIVSGVLGQTYGTLIDDETVELTCGWGGDHRGLLFHMEELKACQTAAEIQVILEREWGISNVTD